MKFQLLDFDILPAEKDIIHISFGHCPYSAQILIFELNMDIKGTEEKGPLSKIKVEHFNLKLAYFLQIQFISKYVTLVIFLSNPFYESGRNLSNYCHFKSVFTPL